MKSFVAGLVALLGLAGCGEVDAPSAPGVCWRALDPAAGAPRFISVSSNVSSLDDCAAQLEAIHLEGAPTVVGAFQGYFIFVDAAMVTSAPSRKGFRYPIFQPAQRAEIDADLRGLIKDRNGVPPSAADIAVERK